MTCGASLGAFVIVAMLLSAASFGAEEKLPEVAGLEATVVKIPSSVDGVEQPCIIGVPASYDPETPTPLLVGLHTWSASYPQQLETYGKQAAKRGWLLVLPHYRGPNLVSNPNARQAGGSLLAQHDVVDGYRYVLEHYSVDAERVYMTGASGGGHMALLMAGKYPDLWAAVAAWCPVTDLLDWHEQNPSYARHVEAVCGGPPGATAEVDFEYLRRSPRTFMTNLAHTHVLLGHGDRDQAIPVEQSWRTFRRLAELPAHRTLFYVFSGGHEDRAAYGLDWCARLTRPQEPPTELHLVTDESKSYYWADLELADAGRLGKCAVKLSEDALSVATENLARVSLELTGLPVPAEGGLLLSVANAEPLRLSLRGLPGAALAAEPGWAVAAPAGAAALELIIEAGTEARTCRIAY
jgi:poly(3-hydroxybutyrate) depolymerase